jgi:hypothetical protein
MVNPDLGLELLGKLYKVLMYAPFHLTQFEYNWSAVAYMQWEV